jgi:3-oxoacyl-[acyl-carrier protein] reductase
MARMLAEVSRAFGALDVLVNTAEVYATMALEAVTEDEFHWDFNTNLLGPLLVIRESLGRFGPDAVTTSFPS